MTLIMEETYLKLASVKFSYDDIQSQAKLIIDILNSFSENEVANFNFQSLSSIYSKEVSNYIIELLLESKPIDINVSIAVYLCSQFNFLDEITNIRLLAKIIDIFRYLNNGNTIFYFLQIISLKFPFLMKSLVSSDFLMIIHNLINKVEIQTYEKIIFLTLQELTEVNVNVITVLKTISRDLDGNDELFLRLISAISITSIVTNDVLHSDILWDLILSNLVSSQSVDRKRAMYWLNRALHTCQNNGKGHINIQLSEETLFLELSDDIINNILILIDALEEKQTHVILPVLGKIDNLKTFFSTGRMSVHWLLTVIERASLHESTIILKWAITEFLRLPVNLSSQSYYRILTTSFIKTFNQSNLYFSPDSISNDNGFFASQPLDAFLNDLFNEFCVIENTDKMEHFLDVISKFPWNSHALLFFAESFSTVVVNGASFSLGTLSQLGSLCRLNLLTLNLKYRQCISAFLLTGFFGNHRIVTDRIIDYCNNIHQNFTLSETLLADPTLVALLVAKFHSLSALECDTIFQAISKAIVELELNNVNFAAAFNRLSCMSLFVVLVSRSVTDEQQVNLIQALLEPVRRSYMNPYANVFHVLKSIIALKELHSVHGIVPNNPDFLAITSNGILSVFVELTKYLSLQIEASELKDESDVNCISVFKYFVKKFPNQMCNMYFEEHSPSILALVAANIPNVMQSVNGHLRLEHILDKRTLVRANGLQYEYLKCLGRYMCHYKDDFRSSSQIEALTDHVCALVDITVPYKGIMALVHLGGGIIMHLMTSESAVHVLRMVKCLWSSVLEHNSNAQIFWKLYSIFLEEILQKLLKVYHRLRNAELFQESLETIIGAIFELGINKFGMVHLLGEMVHDFFLKESVTINEQNSEFYIHLVGRLVLFGPCHRRGLRFENRIEKYLNRRYLDRWNSYRINKTAESGERVGGLLIMCLKTAWSVAYKEEMISYLRIKDKELIGNNVKSYKNYANNHIHRTRHRLFSALLLLLESCVTSISSDCLDSLELWMKDLIQYESLNSIRHLCEWIYTILCINNKMKQRSLVATVQTTGDSKPAYVCSLINVCRHLIMGSVTLADDLVLAIMPLGSAQNYNIRLYAAAFVSVVHQHRLIDPANQSLNAIVNGYVSFLDRSTTSKNVTKLLSNFWWSKFVPTADVCLETVFEVLPPLFDLVEEEIISIDQFISVSGDESLYDIQFRGNRLEWREPSDSVWRVKTEMGSGVDVSPGDDGDVQKKVQPWITCRPDEDLLRELYGPIERATDLVLVCSLVNKATNIGGLARTSNIFGVGEFVVDNLRVTEDNNFRQLAVTADKWINMTEVAVKALGHFLAVKRSEGYEIVGIEQTANSVSLQSVSFKSKTVLLLGNEKEGIPVDLIARMDKCIQIPQLGQIRSLNVHVSGAIVLWEYMKQIRLLSL